MAVKPIPDGYHSLTPTIVVQDGATKLIDFLQEVFGARERLRMPLPDGRVGHSELEIGDSVVMVSDAVPEFGARSCAVHVYLEDVDAAYKRALDAGATSEMEPADQFYGDRSAAVVDSFGNHWLLATHIEDVSEEEAMSRLAAMTPQS
jgi:uncharacterized glyoxalase superfamily protein PhnB